MAPGTECPVAFLDGGVLIPNINGSVAGQTPMSFNGWAVCEGTSYSAAIVTGAVAAGIGAGRTARQALDVLFQPGGGAPYGIHPA